MKSTSILRGSPEHMKAIAEIDYRYNGEVDSSQKRFRLAHPGIDVEASEQWQEILAEIEGRRLEDCWAMRKRVVDPPRI